MAKNKIGIIIYSNPDYYPPTINAIHLLAEYFDIVLISRNQDPSHWKYPSNVKVYRLGQYTSVQERETASKLSKLLEYIKFIFSAYQLLKDVSLIYAYESFGYIAAYFSRILLLYSVPIVYHNHDISQNLFSIFSLSRWVQILERSTAQNAAIVVFPSQERASFFRKVSRLKQSPVIVPNLPRKEFFKMSNKLNLQGLIFERFNQKQILLQGSISKQNSMIELIKSLSASDIFFTIKFIGTIREEEYALMIKNADKENVSDRINYFNFVPYIELQLHTWMASLGVCLYKNINLNNQTMATASNKIYEYAACGLPVIVSDFPNYRKYLDNESWVRFADPDNPHSIAAAVQDILSDFENYRKMCLAARQAFEEKFNYETVFLPLLLKIKKLVDESEKK